MEPIAFEHNKLKFHIELKILFYWFEGQSKNTLCIVFKYFQIDSKKKKKISGLVNNSPHVLLKVKGIVRNKIFCVHIAINQTNKVNLNLTVVYLWLLITHIFGKM